MAKPVSPKGKSDGEDGEVRHQATRKWKLWAREQKKLRDLTFEEIALQIKRLRGRAVSPEAIHLLFGSEDKDPIDSTSVLVPYINEIFGAAPPPPPSDPTNPRAQLIDRLRAAADKNEVVYDMIGALLDTGVISPGDERRRKK